MAFDEFAIVTKSIKLTYAPKIWPGFGPPPPLQTPRVDDELGAGIHLAFVRSPKSSVFPCD